MRLRALAILTFILAVFASVLGPVTANAATETLFGSAVPLVRADSDAQSVTLGLKFTTKTAGKVTGVRFYKGTGNTGTHVGALYSATGTQLAKATFKGESATGWQSVTFAGPVNVAAGAVLTAAELGPKGHYAVSQPYAWSKAGTNLTGLAGVYKYGSAISYPTSTYKASNYFVDVNFTVTPSPTPTPTATPTSSPTPIATPTPTSTPTPTATPTPTSSPTPTATPTSSPTSGAKPGPSNTGVPAGTVLTPYTGPKTITTAGTVIDSKDVTGALVIQAKNVVIRNSKIHDDPSAVAGIYSDGGSVTITDSEIYNFQVGITYSNWTAIRVNLHDITFDGVKISSNTRLQDSWIHNAKPTSDAHWDGAQVQNGVTNTVIQGNFIDSSGADTNTALFLCPDLGPSTNGPLTVTGNWLNGGNFTVAILDGNNGQYFIRDIFVTNNRFGNNFSYGHSNVNVPITQSGNVIDSTGAAYTL